MNKIVYREGYKYQLQLSYYYETDIMAVRPLGNDWVQLYPTGQLYIKKGYAWDGPSGPTIDTKDSMRASLIHDGIYQLIREGYLGTDWREHADNIFYNVLREDGMSKIRAWIWYQAVRWFGGKSLEPQKKPLTAP